MVEDRPESIAAHGEEARSPAISVFSLNVFIPTK